MAASLPCCVYKVIIHVTIWLDGVLLERSLYQENQHPSTQKNKSEEAALPDRHRRFFVGRYPPVTVGIHLEKS